MSPAQAARQLEAGTGIPIVDLGPVLANGPGAFDQAVLEVGEASESLGFFYLCNRDVPQAHIDRMLVHTERFHGLALERKMDVKVLAHNIGYLPLGGQTQRSCPSLYGPSRHPDRSASYFLRAEYPETYPDRLALGVRQPPARRSAGIQGDLSGVFRRPDLARRPGARTAVRGARPQCGLHPETRGLQPATSCDCCTTRHATRHWKASSASGGTATTATVRFTQAKVAGLEIITREGDGVEAPALAGQLLFNHGDMCQRWTNDRFRSAPHRAINKSGRNRYSIPFFVSTRMDVPLACLPTCQGPENPAKYPPDHLWRVSRATPEQKLRSAQVASRARRSRSPHDSYDASRRLRTLPGRIVLGVKRLARICAGPHASKDRIEHETW